VATLIAGGERERLGIRQIVTLFHKIRSPTAAWWNRIMPEGNTPIAPPEMNAQLRRRRHMKSQDAIGWPIRFELPRSNNNQSRLAFRRRSNFRRRVRWPK
jgi:hypothetical protein